VFGLPLISDLHKSHMGIVRYVAIETGLYISQLGLMRKLITG